MPELLTGTVTFLFTDIEGSTRLLQSHGEGWPAILARHQELLRAAFAAEAGVEVGTEGDSFFVTFPTAPGAVAAALSAQRALAGEPWPDGAEVRVRMGMHTGEASFGTEGYVGLHVHRASRIASVGHGGQVLLSDTTRSLVREALPDGRRAAGPRESIGSRISIGPSASGSSSSPVSRTTSRPSARSTRSRTTCRRRLTTFLGREREIAEISGAPRPTAGC